MYSEGNPCCRNLQDRHSLSKWYQRGWNTNQLQSRQPVYSRCYVGRKSRKSKWTIIKCCEEGNGLARLEFDHFSYHDFSCCARDPQEELPHAIAANEWLTKQREQVAVIFKKQIKPKETPIIL